MSDHPSELECPQAALEYWALRRGWNDPRLKLNLLLEFLLLQHPETTVELFDWLGCVAECEDNDRPQEEQPTQE